MHTSLCITREEFNQRTERLLEHSRSRGLKGVVLFDSAYIHYFTGFAFIPTERPIAFVMNAEGERAMFVPRLELEHARQQTGFERIEHYVEYPYKPHPMHVLAGVLGRYGHRRADRRGYDGYPWVFGYRAQR